MCSDRWWLALCLMLCACSTKSVYPFYEPGQTYVDTTLLGAWHDSSGTEGAVLTRSGGQYDIEFRNKDGQSAHFTGTLFRLAGRTLLDVTVGELPDSTQRRAPDEYWSLLLPVHAVFFLNWSPARLAFVEFEADSVKSYLRAHPDAVRHLLVGNDSTPLLTPPTPELQRFALTMAQRAHVFGDSTVWRRTTMPPRPSSRSTR